MSYPCIRRGEAAGAMEVVMSKVTLMKGDEKRGGMLKEVALDALGELCVIPGLLQELYINFDCSMRSPNLFQKLMLFLSKVLRVCVGVCVHACVRNTWYSHIHTWC
jgi:hypothetical protein